MGKTFTKSPDHEYTLQDLTVTAVNKLGARFAFREGDIGLLEEVMYDPKPESKTMQGSGANPRAHTTTVNKPTCELTMPVDTATRFKRFVGSNGVVNMIFTRKVPGGKSVTDTAAAWKPLFAGPSFKSGDAATRKVTGNALRIDEDVRGVLA